MTLPVPAYGLASLSDVLPGVLAALGAPPASGACSSLPLPPAAGACLLLVDGLGAGLLDRHRADAPFLAGLPSAAPVGGLTAGFPTTTAVSLTSLGTGLTPGNHGLVGYTFRRPSYLPPGERPLLNALRWGDGIDPVAVQPAATLFERARQAGVDACAVGPSAFDGVGLTLAALRGGRYAGADSPGERVAVAAELCRRALTAGTPPLVYVYIGDLDATGHRSGCTSAAWRAQLAHADLLARQLAEALPAGVDLYVTADHGMVDVPPENRLDLAAPDAAPLLEGVDLVGGEPRVRHLYVRDGAADDVAAAWRQTLGDRAAVLTRDEAADLLGGLDDRWAERVGDLVVVPGADLAVVDTVAEPFESRLVGLHGGLTLEELLVPFLRAAG